ncbi:MAG: pilus assembly protein TadG-related protein [Hyphomicrobiaceae bacterium]
MRGLKPISMLYKSALKATTAASAKLGLVSAVKDEQGQIALIFAAMIVPIVILVGSAVDYGQGFRKRTVMQLALDSAVLAAGRTFDTTGEIEAAEAAGAQFFNAAMEEAGIEAEITSNTADGQGNVIMTAAGVQHTSFLKIVNQNELEIKVEAKSLTSDQGGKDVELAIVFDVTGSMTPELNSGGVDRMAVAKQAAEDLVDILIPPTHQPRSVRFSLVPFSNMVNLGDYAEDVTGVPDQATVTETYTDRERVRVCTEYKRNGTCKNWDWQWQDVERQRDVTTYRRNCVVERMDTSGHAYDDAPPSQAPFHAFTTTDSGSVDCTPQYPIVPLTNHRQTLLDAIDDLEGGGGTAGHIGLAWGWYTISEAWNEIWPSDREAAEANPDERLKALILMTDGEFNRHYDSNFNSVSDDSSGASRKGNGLSADQAAALCENMKDDGVEVFAVGIELTSNSARSMLQDCVSDPNNFFEEHYYDVANSLASQNGLRAAFQDIGNNIASATGTGNQRLRITR